MMQEQDTELEGWKQEWQSLGGRSDLARSLAERVKQDGRRLQRELVTELAWAAGSTALCVWLMVDSGGKPVVAVACAATLLFTGVWVTRLLTLKYGPSNGADSGLDAFVELTRQRLAADLKWHLFRRRSLDVATLFTVPWTVWAILERYSLYTAQPWVGVAEVGLLIALLVGMFIYLPRKIRALEAARDRFEALVDDRTLS
jgi:hypothetical protein